MKYVNTTTELYHHGVKGQKWGVRRYQNKDGSYKPSARGRYSDSDVAMYQQVMAEEERQRKAERRRKILKGAAITAGIIAGGVAAGVLYKKFVSDPAKAEAAKKADKDKKNPKDEKIADLKRDVEIETLSQELAGLLNKTGKEKVPAEKQSQSSSESSAPKQIIAKPPTPAKSSTPAKPKTYGTNDPKYAAELRKRWAATHEGMHATGRGVSQKVVRRKESSIEKLGNSQLESLARTDYIRKLESISGSRSQAKRVSQALSPIKVNSNKQSPISKMAKNLNNDLARGDYINKLSGVAAAYEKERKKKAREQAIRSYRSRQSSK